MSDKHVTREKVYDAFVDRAKGFPRGVNERPGSVTLHCPKCQWDFYMPVQPVYDLKFVAALLGIRYQTLVKFLQDHKGEYPRRYRWWSQALRVRVLFADEVQRIQKHYIRRRFKVADSVAEEQRNAGSQAG